MRATLSTLRGRIEELVIASRDVAQGELEDALDYPTIRVRDRPYFRHGTVDGRPKPTPPRNLGRGARAEMLACLAETHLLARALDRAHDAEQHAVVLELCALGRGRTLLRWLAHAYAKTRGEVDGVAGLSRGEIHEGPVPDEAKDPEAMVLRIVGPCIRDFFELETGTHVWHALAQKPELVRVRVLAGRGVGAAEALQALSDERAKGPKILPLVRSVRFDPPRAGRPPQVLELDDYVLGISQMTRANDLYDVLSPLWLLRASRIDTGAGEDA
jgi:ATP-dependent Clp protease ATP-binding subunit ClpA/ATP-dependent Clp protease ATP-binding subunit ClpC